MPLYNLLNSPIAGNRPLNEWAFAHAQDHIEIMEAIQQQKGINLTRYILDPLNIDDMNNWLDRHQQTHDDMNSIFALNGVDLESVDIQDTREMQTWTYLNFMEHRAVRQALGI